MALRGINWTQIRRTAAPNLSTEEIAVLQMLVEGKGTPEIARALGRSRSWVWRTAERMAHRSS